MRRIFLLAFLMGSFAFSANEESPHTSQHGVGFAAGGTSAVGVAYRGFFANGFGLQTTLGAFGTSRYFDMFGGLQVMYKFHRSSSSILSYYVLAGSGVILESLAHWTLIPGAGVGMEIAIYKGLTAALDISLAPYVPIGRSPTILGYIPLPLPGLAVVYYF